MWLLGFFSVTGISSPMSQLLFWNSKLKGFFGLYIISNVFPEMWAFPILSLIFISFSNVWNSSILYHVHIAGSLYSTTSSLFLELFWLQSAYVTRSFTYNVIEKRTRDSKVWVSLFTSVSFLSSSKTTIGVRIYSYLQIWERIIHFGRGLRRNHWRDFCFTKHIDTWMTSYYISM